MPESLPPLTSFRNTYRFGSLFVFVEVRSTITIESNLTSLLGGTTHCTAVTTRLGSTFG